MSERVTWETCPTCRHAAAAGWLDGRLVEFDCPAGCNLTVSEVRTFLDRRRRPVEQLRET